MPGVGVGVLPLGLAGREGASPPQLLDTPPLPLLLLLLVRLLLWLHPLLSPNPLLQPLHLLPSQPQLLCPSPRSLSAGGMCISWRVGGSPGSPPPRSPPRPLSRLTLVRLPGWTTVPPRLLPLQVQLQATLSLPLGLCLRGPR